MSREHVVQQGETLPDIARRYGFADWKVVYGHASNSQLRQSRPDPYVLFPGDRVHIPDLEAKAVSRPTGGAASFTVQTRSTLLRLRLVDRDGKPLADAPYTLTFTGKPPLQGRTKGDGTLEHPVPPTVRDALLQLEKRVMRLRLGHLNPLEKAPDEGVSGAQSRLANLGYAVGEATGTLDAATKVALATFQADHGLQVSGKLDSPTRKKLAEAHGC